MTKCWTFRRQRNKKKHTQRKGRRRRTVNRRNRKRRTAKGGGIKLGNISKSVNLGNSFFPNIIGKIQETVNILLKKPLFNAIKTEPNTLQLQLLKK